MGNVRCGIFTKVLAELVQLGRQIAEEKLNSSMPLKRPGKPNDTEAAAVFSTQPAAEWTAGQCTRIAA